MVFDCLNCFRYSYKTFLVFVPTEERRFRMVSNCWKQILEAAKLAYANKTGVYHFQEMITFGKLPIDFPAKVYLLYLLYLIVLKYCCSVPDRTIFFPQIFLVNYLHYSGM